MKIRMPYTYAAWSHKYIYDQKCEEHAHACMENTHVIYIRRLEVQVCILSKTKKTHMHAWKIRMWQIRMFVCHGKYAKTHMHAWKIRMSYTYAAPGRAHNRMPRHLCMYVCMYVRMYVCMYVRMYVCMYVRMYVCMYVRMYVCMYVRMCVFNRMPRHKCTVQVYISCPNMSHICPNVPYMS